MTTRLELDYQGETLTVTGEYFPKWTFPSVQSDFVIGCVEQNGLDVTDHYRKHRTIPMLELMALEMIEGD